MLAKILENKYIKKIHDLLRYGLVAAISYPVIYGGTFVLVTLGLTENTAYLITLSFVYIGVYFAYTNFVFRKNTSKKTIVRFLVSLLLIWVINNTSFAVFHNLLHLHYLIAITLNIIIFGGIKFLIQKMYVFKD